MEFIQAANYTRGRARKLRLIVVHSTQSPCNQGSARSVANYFARGPGASSHYICDPTATVQCVDDADTAWCAPNANADGLHIEQCGYAEWSRTEWLTDGVGQMIRTQVAPLVAVKAARYGIPLVALTPAQVAAGASGICQHIDVTNAYPGSGSHWDCGSSYPMDLLMELAGGTSLSPAEIPPIAVTPTGVQPVSIPATLRPGTGLPGQNVWIYDVAGLTAEGEPVPNQGKDGPKVKASGLVVRHAVPNGDTPAATLTIVWGSGAAGYATGGLQLRGAEERRYPCPKSGIASVISDRPLVVHSEIYA